MIRDYRIALNIYSNQIADVISPWLSASLPYNMVLGLTGPGAEEKKTGDAPGCGLHETVSFLKCIDGNKNSSPGVQDPGEGRERRRKGGKNGGREGGEEREGGREREGGKEEVREGGRKTKVQVISQSLSRNASLSGVFLYKKFSLTLWVRSSSDRCWPKMYKALDSVALAT